MLLLATGPCTLRALRDQWGYPILFNQPDGERWRKIFELHPVHWRNHSILLDYPDGVQVVLNNWWSEELTWTARITYKVYAIADTIKAWYRRNF